MVMTISSYSIANHYCVLLCMYNVEASKADKGITEGGKRENKSIR